MDEKLVQELLDEFLPTLEALETKNTAITQFLKDKGIFDDEQLAPYIEQAGNASNVKWRATRLRLNHLISFAAKAAERANKKESANERKESAVAGKESPESAKEDTSPEKNEGENKKQDKFVNVKEGEQDTVKPAAQEHDSDGKSPSERDEKAKQDAA